jgi:hypothetical protein
MTPSPKRGDDLPTHYTSFYFENSWWLSLEMTSKEQFCANTGDPVMSPTTVKISADAPMVLYAEDDTKASDAPWPAIKFISKESMYGGLLADVIGKALFHADVDRKTYASLWVPEQ